MNIRDLLGQIVFNTEKIEDCISDERISSNWRRVAIRSSCIEIDSCVEKIERLLTDRSLDYIHDYCESLLRAGEFERLNNEIAEIDITKTSVDIMLALLTATLPAKSKLPARADLFRRVEVTIIQQGQMEEGLLGGLE